MCVCVHVCLHIYKHFCPRRKQRKNLQKDFRESENGEIICSEDSQIPMLASKLRSGNYSLWTKSLLLSVSVWFHKNIAKNEFLHILVVEKKSKDYFCNIWKLYGIYTSVLVSKVLLKHIHAYSFMYYLWLLLCCKTRAE